MKNINPDNEDDVIWLQRALAKLGPRGAVQMGIFDPLTQKVISNYQNIRGLPVTGLPDEATMQKIEEDLAAAGLTIS